MLDFMIVSQNEMIRYKKKIVEVSPTFLIKNNSKDLMIRGGDFYAVWNEETGLWSTDEGDAIQIIDRLVQQETEKVQKEYAGSETIIQTKYIWNAKSGVVDQWHKYCQKQLRDNYHQLDTKVIFSNTDVKKEDYVSKRLPYPLEECATPSYDELMGTLYSPEERRKLEWAVGAIISGDSKKIQKFIVLYGSAGSGKSTFLNILQMLFEGYYSFFDSKTLGSAKNDFALEDFKSNPLVAIQHDGDLSRIEDNTKLNSIVSHETMLINEKFKNKYTMRFDSFIFMGTNKPVRITEAKSGLIRRLIDVRPSGNRIDFDRYNILMEKVKFELSGIAWHCLQVYKELGDAYYNNYIPTDMISATNDFYDFMENYYDHFCREPYVTLVDVWALYKKYCDFADVKYSFSMRAVRTELMNYFEEFKRQDVIDGDHVRNVYIGFRKDKFFSFEGDEVKKRTSDLVLDKTESIFDKECASCPAQYGNDEEKPMRKWENVKTTLSDIDTSRLHYVRVPLNHIVIDFDLKDENGNKSYERNLLEASKWPLTYAELSKGGAGIHLHYIYDGDVTELSRVYSEDIEIKVFNGNSSLRRKLTKCNDIPIATINSGLPLKGGKNVVDFEMIKSEKALRGRIEKCLRKEHHGATAPEVDFIFKILEDAYASGMTYDVSDMRPKILAFANNSSHQREKCVKTVAKMHFYSEIKDDAIPSGQYESDELIFFDVEVFPNLFVVVWKAEDKDCVKMINPSPSDISDLLRFKLVGFNCRRYDNHILYARTLGYDNHQLYLLSQRIVNGSRNSMFGPAYSLSYTDVYDFCSKKQSLKKWEIELGIHHQELGLKWDEDAPEDKWELVADYCVNDVVATEAVFKARKQDFVAREILADISGLTVNDTTNSHTTRLIVGTEKNPQSEFVYTDLREMFPGYTFDNGRSTYQGEEVGEGGYVYAEPGMYGNVALLDIASMHPTSAINLNIFGPYTKNFKELVQARLEIKHKNYEEAGKLFDGKLKPYLDDPEQATSLAYALKIAINSVYGLTAAKFENKLRDPRNKDNIVAKRGALFMIDLKKEVQKRGYTVAHIKTDSIKIPDADEKIINFVIEFGKKYGYTFEHEDTYDKMCLVNDAVYIARHKDGTWTATGAQFAQPYVFKTLFSKEQIIFEDMCETKSVSTALYLDMNENLPEGEHNYAFVGKAGSFCPIKPGCGGGLLMRESGDKFTSATGAKGYRWLEAEMVKNFGKEDDIDRTYYAKLVDDAVDNISKFGDFEWFTAEEPYNGEFDVPF